ncbi:MAG: Zn-dependent protease with chaperone function [Phycisphaerae bacterium]|nr:Zn-dependent protease with chaperone function [Phycisphaerae bacterium]
MATNFFEQQDHARRRTGLLVTCFLVGLILMIAVLYAVGMIIFNMVAQDDQSTQIQVQYFNGWVLLGVAALTTAIVGGASLFKIIELRSGGRAVAEMLGARQLDPATRVHEERVALNVVEEMAIASGTPVPPVYVVEDQSINAFAAGWSPNDAIVSLNRGTMQKLNRDELQGVVAHEFSHIFNGDMRINIRLIGVIHGLLVLGVTGWVCLRFIGPAMLGSGRRSSSKNDGGGGIGAAIMLFGLALMLCGFIGTFFGRLIQAAVSRQREYLADASAVQYTRNPDGIGGALEKIKLAGSIKSSKASEKASEINHMFFTKGFDSIFATHPPLADRISRVRGISQDQVQQHLQETASRMERQSSATAPEPSARVHAQAEKRRMAGDIMGGVILGSVLDHTVNRIGSIDSESLQHSRDILESIPDALKDAAHAAPTAQMLVYCLILDEDSSDQSIQWSVLEKIPGMQAQQMRQYQTLIEKLDIRARLPLLDLCIPSLSQMSETQYRSFRENFERLIRVDGRIDRWEWVVDTVIDRHLEERYHKPGAERKARGKLESQQSSVVVVLATLACIGSDDKAAAETAFGSSMNVLGWQAPFPDPSSLKLNGLRAALKAIRRVRFKDRGRFLEACKHCILMDGKTTVEEAETLRAVAESIDCPMPLHVTPS